MALGMAATELNAVRNRIPLKLEFERQRMREKRREYPEDIKQLKKDPETELFTIVVNGYQSSCSRRQPSCIYRMTGDFCLHSPSGMAQTG